MRETKHLGNMLKSHPFELMSKPTNDFTDLLRIHMKETYDTKIPKEIPSIKGRRAKYVVKFNSLLQPIASVDQKTPTVSSVIEGTKNISILHQKEIIESPIRSNSKPK